ncbi:meiotic recombination protein REC114 [Rhynochetos jubatus]
MAVAGRGSVPGQVSAPGGAGDTSLVGSATTWALKRYGRFLPPMDGDDEGQNTSSWKVVESNEESGHLVLTIVVSGHFFISQGRTVLEGFSLIDSHKWLKIVRRADCLLLCAQSKNECRMFRIQFGGDSKEEMLEHCCSCVRKLAEYVPVQVTDEHSQQLYHTLGQLADGEDQLKGAEQRASVPRVRYSQVLLTSSQSDGGSSLVKDLEDHIYQLKNTIPAATLARIALGRVLLYWTVKSYLVEKVWGKNAANLTHTPFPGRHMGNFQQPIVKTYCLFFKQMSYTWGLLISCAVTQGKENSVLLPDEPLPDSCSSLGETRSVAQLAQAVLKKSPELPLVHQHAAWRAQELGPFIRLCLMDQNFPAFVEDVEKELKKLTEG